MSLVPDGLLVAVTLCPLCNKTHVFVGFFPEEVTHVSHAHSPT